MAVRDVIVNRVRRVREDLIKGYGGLEGYFRHLQELDREHQARARAAGKAARRGKLRAAPTARKKARKPVVRKA